MITIEIDFLNRQYHATPWDAHVNEGRVEWPPSPWRLLRALLASWHLRHPDTDEAVISAIIHKLSSEAPVYALPHGQITHTRHYMPVGLDKAKLLDSTSKVLDGFIAFSGDTKVFIHWENVLLLESEREILASLLGSIPYFGRAESWASLSLLEETPEGVKWNVLPQEDTQKATQETGQNTDISRPPKGHHWVRVLAPLVLEDFDRWYEAEAFQSEVAALQEAIEKAQEKGKKPPVGLSEKAKDRALAHLPSSLTGALEFSTSDMQQSGWSAPPGSQWLHYAVPDAIHSDAGQVKAIQGGWQSRPSVIRYAINSSVLPSIQDALSVCNRVRLSLIKISDGASIFSGHGKNGAALIGHQHAYIIAEPNLSTGKITHISLYAKDGFSESDCVAASKLQRVWGRGGYDIHLSMVSVTAPKEIGGLNQSLEKSPSFFRSRIWESQTPFVPVRHPKANRKGIPKIDPNTGLQIGSPAHDLIRLAELQGFPRIARVDPLQHFQLKHRSIKWLSFHLKEDSQAARSSQRGYGFRIEFEREVEGPLLLGYGAHRGLGLFRAVT